MNKLTNLNLSYGPSTCQTKSSTNQGNNSSATIESAKISHKKHFIHPELSTQTAKSQETSTMFLKSIMRHDLDVNVYFYTAEFKDVTIRKGSGCISSPRLWSVSFPLW